jgi:hypothetical protein
VPGLKFIHHNVFDNTRKMLWTRNDPLNLRNPNEQGWQYIHVFSSHTGTATEGDPWKIYNNTFAYGHPVNNSELAISAWLTNNLGVAHEVINNILVQEVGIPKRIHSGTEMTTGREIYDGNLHYSAVGAPVILANNVKRGDGSIVVPDHADFRPAASDSFTICGWVFRPVHTTHMVWLQRGDADTQYTLRFISNGRLQLILSDGTTTIDVFSSSAAAHKFDDGAWHHLAAVVDRAGSTARIYRDGVQSGSSGISSLGDVSLPEADLIVGNGGKLSLSDLRFYRRALSATEVETLAADGEPDATSLVARWPLDDGAGLTASDSVGGHHASFVGEQDYSAPVWGEGRTGAGSVALHLLHTRADFPSLAALRDSLEAAQSKRYYTPGWEAASVEGLDPELHATTRVPQAGAGVRAGAVRLWEERPDWPGVSGAYAVEHRGAFLPGADGSEVGFPL